MKIVARAPMLVVGVVVGLVMGLAAYAGSGSVVRAIASGAIVVAYAVLVTVLRRRSEMLSVLAGAPVDERWEHINQEACVWAFGLSAVALLAVFVVTDVSGGDWVPYALIGAVMAVSYLGSLLVLRLRH